MPFKSRKQERYLQINEPDIYEDWVEEYGHFKGAEAFSAEGIDGSRAKSGDYWLYHGHNSDGSWCGQKLWVSKGHGYDYLCSCNATLYRDDAVLSAKNPKKLPEPKDPKTTPYGTIFIHEFMSEAESFSAEVIACDYCEKTGGGLYSTVSLYKCKEGCDV